MTKISIFRNWDTEHTELWGRQPIMLTHRLDLDPLFSMDYLAELIERYPEDRYMLVHMGAQGTAEKLWNEGKIGGASGREVIERIRNERFWINLLQVNKIDPGYQKLLDSIYEEIHSHLPDYPRTYSRVCGILISSPRAQVYYHFDTAGQNLWQIHGSKKVYLYPTEPPFLRQQDMEEAMLYQNEIGITYYPWYDKHARVFDLTPGQMLHWRLNSPHRIENGDELSVSLTTEYFTSDIKRHVISSSANGLLRQWKMNPAWVPYLAKRALYGIANRSGMLNTARYQRRPVTFTLDHLKETS